MARSRFRCRPTTMFAMFLLFMSILYHILLRTVMVPSFLAGRGPRVDFTSIYVRSKQQQEGQPSSVNSKVHVSINDGKAEGGADIDTIKNLFRNRNMKSLANLIDMEMGYPLNSDSMEKRDTTVDESSMSWFQRAHEERMNQNASPILHDSVDLVTEMTDDKEEREQETQVEAEEEEQQQEEVDEVEEEEQEEAKESQEEMEQDAAEQEVQDAEEMASDEDRTIQLSSRLSEQENEEEEENEDDNNSSGDEELDLEDEEDQDRDASASESISVPVPSSDVADDEEDELELERFEDAEALERAKETLDAVEIDTSLVEEDEPEFEGPPSLRSANRDEREGGGEEDEEEGLVLEEDESEEDEEEMNNNEDDEESEDGEIDLEEEEEEEEPQDGDDDGEEDDDEDNNEDDEIDEYDEGGTDRKSSFGISRGNLEALLSSRPNPDDMENPEDADDQANEIKCKEIPLKSMCAEYSHCYWSSDMRSCRTTLSAMACSMTQVKTTCLKLKDCVWGSYSRIRGRYCKDKPETPPPTPPTPPPTKEQKTFEPEFDPITGKVRCRSVPGKSICEEYEHCFWSKDPPYRGCRTHLWAQDCSMTQVKTRCLKMGNCTWTRASKDKGKYCKQKPITPPPTVPVAPAPGVDPAATGKIVESDEDDDGRTRCKKISSKTTCDGYEHCVWSKGSCKTEVWALQCAQTQLRDTCKQIPGCSWTGKGARGRYCVESKTLQIQKEQISAAINGSLPANQTVDPALAGITPVVQLDSVRKVEVRLGNSTQSLARCKSINVEAICDAFPHCSWVSNSCRTEKDFTPCSATALKAKCETMRHCVWSARQFSRGKYCFDRFYVENPDELNIQCTKFREKSKCNSQLACEWRSSKSIGRYCERVVSLSKAQEELEQMFPDFEEGLFNQPDSNVSSNVEQFEFIPDPEYDAATDPERIGCPQSTECMSPDDLAKMFKTPVDSFRIRSKYRQAACCTLHSDYEKMLIALTSHFQENRFSDWWLDEGFLIGMARFKGQMPPWMQNAAISVISNDPKTIRTLMEKFNEDFAFRPFSIRGCGPNQKGETSCKVLSKFTPTKKLDYYLVSHMDLVEGPEMKIYEKTVTKTYKRCVFANDGRPIPLSLVQESVPCPYPIYNKRNLRCPKSIVTYLDLHYGESWRNDVFTRKVLPAPAWKSPDPGVSSSSSFEQKLLWLKRKHCPTL